MTQGATRGRSRAAPPAPEPEPEQQRTIAADEPVADSGATRSSRKRKRKQGRKH